jgi:hypothetical protein
MAMAKQAQKISAEVMEVNGAVPSGRLAAHQDVGSR